MIGKAEDPIIKRSIGRKQTQITYTRDGSDKRTKTLLTPDADATKPSFSDEEAKTLAEWCVKIEDHYSKHHGHPTPMDIEWAKDGITGELFIVQARPETVRKMDAASLFLLIELPVSTLFINLIALVYLIPGEVCSRGKRSQTNSSDQSRRAYHSRKFNRIRCSKWEGKSNQRCQ